VSSSVEQNVHTTFSFPDPLSEPEECVEASAVILDAIRRSFLTKPATAAMFTSVQFEPILDDDDSRHLLPAPFRLELKTTT